MGLYSLKMVEARIKHDMDLDFLPIVKPKVLDHLHALFVKLFRYKVNTDSFTNGDMKVLAYLIYELSIRDKPQYHPTVYWYSRQG